MNRRKSLRGVAALAVAAIALAGCSVQSDDGGSESESDQAAPTRSNPQPDLNDDGKVIIGIMSPGDTKDKGYYQGFVDGALDVADSLGWQTIIIDKINPADAIEQAKNLCRQHADLIGIGAGELKDAMTAHDVPECADTDWYITTSDPIEQEEFFAQSKNILQEHMFTAGYAAGELMKADGATQAGFIGGTKVDFTEQAATAFLKGIQEVLPDADLATTYTGNFDDSAKAREAAEAQIARGAKVIYPYLGGASDAVANLANEKGVYTISPGSDRCSDDSVHYDISSIFSPGAFFAAALNQFKDDALEMGSMREWRLGHDEVPTVKACGDHADLQSTIDEVMTGVAAGTYDIGVETD